MATSIPNVPNFYPEVPVVDYLPTSVDMPTVVLFAKTIIGTYGLEVVRTTYCIFRNESGNGLHGVNNNYAGIQADNRKWVGLNGVVATCVRKDGNNEWRRFVCFSAETVIKYHLSLRPQKLKSGACI